MAHSDLEAMGRRVGVGAKEIARASNSLRQEALRRAAFRIREQSSAILDANAQDVAEGIDQGLNDTSLDRLRLDANRIEAMAQSLEDVADLPDPLGVVVDSSTRPNGLEVSRVRAPLGVVGVIYENRPNVTSDVAGLCIRSGNGVYLRGSSTSLASNKAIVSALRQGLKDVGLHEDVVALVEDTSHETAISFMQLRGILDVVIPRGGPSLIASMEEHATVPVVLDGDGNCHVYVDTDADIDMAISIIVNAKTQRPGVCNAMESLVLHQDVAGEILARLDTEMANVELVGDERACALLPRVSPAGDEDYSTEFLGFKASVVVVDSLEEAVDHIGKHSSGHSEAIVTRKNETAERFLSEVDAAAVLWNASTRFVDGGELGLGSEVGISTQKLHARGPMGLEALTSVRWVIRGQGQVRT